MPRPLMLLLVAAAITSLAAAETLNVYSSRHYGGDADLFGAFTAATGIEVNVVEAKGPALIARIRREGANCPADILITVDAGGLGAAVNAGILQGVESDALNAAIPADLRDAEGRWFAFGKRARIIAYNPATVSTDQLPMTYEDLATPTWRGRIAVRSSSNIYNQSLLASLIYHHGAAGAQAWAEGVVANMAREPQGNDRAQIRAVAAGEADIAIVNHYYYAKMLYSDNAEEVEVANQVAMHFLGQAEGGRGAHVNISGAGIPANAPNRDAAVRFLEFLATPEGQRLFVAPSFEYPVVDGVEVSYEAFPSFKEDRVPADVLGQLNREAIRTFDRAGWR